MHSFHHSRGRIVFEALCALTIGAAGAAAWLQTGASAMLAIAGVATLFGLVRATDAARRSGPVTSAAQAVEPAPPAQSGLLATGASVEVEPPAEDAPKPAKAPRSRKKKAVVEIVEAAAAEPEEAAMLVAEPVPNGPEDEQHVVTPLFEPQPLVRQQRAVFGRKAG